MQPKNVHVSEYFLMELGAKKMNQPVKGWGRLKVVSCSNRPDLKRCHQRTIFFCKSGGSLLSRPLLKIAMWRYWFRLSRYVYGGNRSFSPVLRQSQWSLLYDVYDSYWWWWQMNWNRHNRVLEQVAGSKYLNTVQDQNCSFSFEQWINKESMRMKTTK